jgi:glycosyltransferase involved in cell wall biosynthesis
VVEPKVDVIIPVRNGEKFISECLQSVLSQEFVNQIIIVDDGSTDMTRDIISKYKEHNSRIEYHHINSLGFSATKIGIFIAIPSVLVFLISPQLAYLLDRFGGKNLFFLRVKTRVQAPEYFAHLTVKTFSWNLLAMSDVLFSFLIVLSSEFWKRIKSLHD